MATFMLDRKISVPAGYAERGCVLVSYRLPLLAHCFVLCSDSIAGQDEGQGVDLMAFFLVEAGRLAQQAVGDPQAFMLIHSGQSIRKRSSWHLHVFVVQRRWQKAWVYGVPSIKNVALAILSSLGRSPGSMQPPNSIERTQYAVRHRCTTVTNEHRQPARKMAKPDPRPR